MVDTTTYWYDHYVNNGHCSLCGNSGIVDTRGVKTNAGLEVGRLNWCICPNGQTLRRMSSKPYPSRTENVDSP